MRLKLRLLGWAGWPDQMYFNMHGRVLFIEYKAPGQAPRPAQIHVHHLLQRYGHYARTIDNIATGCRILELFAQEYQDQQPPKEN
jgi:hypothetical protein